MCVCLYHTGWLTCEHKHTSARTCMSASFSSASMCLGSCCNPAWSRTRSLARVRCKEAFGILFSLKRQGVSWEDHRAPCQAINPCCTRGVGVHVCLNLLEWGTERKLWGEIFCCVHAPLLIWAFELMSASGKMSCRYFRTLHHLHAAYHSVCQWCFTTLSSRSPNP